MSDVFYPSLQQINAAFKEAQHLKLREDYSDLIENLNDKSYRHRANCLLFGSRMMGVASPSSDVDIFVELPKCKFNSSILV